MSINKLLVTELAEQQAEKAKSEINSIVGQLTNKALTSEQISEILRDLNLLEKEIDSFPAEENLLEELKIEQKKFRYYLNSEFYSKLLFIFRLILMIA